MSDRNRNRLPNNLPQLQNLVKRDPDSYREEFLQQFRHYESNLQIFKLDPSNANKTLGDLVMFISQVAHCYTDELEHFPQELIDVLQRHHSVMDAELRMVLCSSHPTSMIGILHFFFLAVNPLQNVYLILTLLYLHIHVYLTTLKA